MRILKYVIMLAIALVVSPNFATTNGGQAIAAKKTVSSVKARKRLKKRRVAKRSKKRRYYGVHARINLSTQRIRVYENGRHRYTWKISSGRSGYRTPTGTWSIKRMHKEYYSRKYDNAPMPYAMFFHGGYALHGTNAIRRLGRPASHGCIRLHPSNAAKLFSMVRSKGGKVSISY